MQQVFRIKNLICEYISDSPILNIEDLDIPKGQLIFVIGKSGIGKSTFIETLGLMNQTIALTDSVSVQFFPETEGAEIELKSSWSLPNQKLSDLRRNYFSFIFQNTNLMPNFSAGENMMMSLLIQNVPVEKAKEKVFQMMKRLSLETEVFDKKITELSGGQRQRLAFVRAVTTKFTVLFGDEPTGNLDENTAHELMGVLKDLIREENKTCIIVSHDLKLARHFADMIIPITPTLSEKGNLVGEIKKSNIIRNIDDKWLDGTEQIPSNNPMPLLRQFLDDNLTRTNRI